MVKVSLVQCVQDTRLPYLITQPNLARPLVSFRQGEIFLLHQFSARDTPPYSFYLYQWCVYSFFGQRRVVA